jgi:hypothetical protein
VQNLVILTFEEVKATLTEKGLVKILKCKWCISDVFTTV